MPSNAYFIVILVFLGFGQLSFASEEENPTIYQVVIDGQEFELKDSQEKRLILGDCKEMEIKISVHPIQPYQLTEIQFLYNTGFSLTDETTLTDRSVTLLHASGYGMVITEHGQADDISQPQLLKNLAIEMLGYIKKGVANNITEYPAEAVELPHARGNSTCSTYLNEDNEKMTFYYYVLQCGKYVASIIGFHSPECESTYFAMQKTILESLKESL